MENIANNVKHSQGLKTLTKFAYKKDDWIAFTIWNIDRVFIRTGYCQIEQLFKNAPPAKEWQELEILIIDADKFKVINACIAVAQVHGVQLDAMTNECRTRTIICNETGEIFESMHAAARKNGGQAGNISNHLANKPGYKTVGGKTYSYYCP